MCTEAPGAFTGRVSGFTGGGVVGGVVVGGADELEAAVLLGGVDDAGVVSSGSDDSTTGVGAATGLVVDGDADGDCDADLDGLAVALAVAAATRVVVGRGVELVAGPWDTGGAGSTWDWEGGEPPRMPRPSRKPAGEKRHSTNTETSASAAAVTIRK